MKRNLPKTRPPGLQAVSSPPSARRRRWLLILLTSVGILGIGGGAGAWWWLRTVPVEPPFPAEVNDPEVQRAARGGRGGKCGPIPKRPPPGVNWG